MTPLKLYMPLILILVFGVSYPVYGSLTLENVDIQTNDSNINITNAVTMERLIIDSDGIITRFDNTKDLREYQFDRKSSSVTYDIRFDSIDTTKAQFTITSIVTDARGNVTGTELSKVELDDVNTAWTYTTLNIIDIDESNKIEYFFPTPPTPTFNAIILSLNSPELDRLGGVFAITCPANHTLTGLLTNGSFICTNMDDFFP